WLKQRVQVKSGKASFETTALIATTMVNGSLSKDTNNDKHPDGWGIFPNVNFIMSNQVKDIQCVTGELVDNPERGKTVLELAEPMTQYELKIGEGEAGRPLCTPAAYKPNRTITTPVILRPDAHYILRFSARGTAGNVGISMPGIFNKSEKAPVDKWAEIKMEFDTPTKLNSNLVYFSMTNGGPGKIWLDAVSLEYVAKTAPAVK
ncbi:MAG: hypothetical protein WCP55_19515, partial [Lentisphaerota bacterium]